MTLELLRAVITLLNFCHSQKQCKERPLREICGKMPCEW